MKTVLLTAAALLSITFGQAQGTYLQNFNGNHNDILNQGWKFITFAGGPQNNGIYSSSASMQAIGIEGGAAGIATFNLVNQIPSHIQNLDCVIVSPPVTVASTATEVSFTTGSVKIGGNGSTHYSVYVITKAQMDAATTPAALKSLLNGRTADDESTISDEAVVTGFDLPDYEGEVVHFVFRVHNSPTNTIFLVDDFKITGAVLGNEHIDQKFLAAYPNPAKDIMTVDYPGIEEISFTDINGRVVSRRKYSMADTVQADVSLFSSGIYIMAVKTAYGVSTRKVIKS
ncbi:MAG: T9SS type A sorting domain-containing protein [Flavobacterium sp.]